MERKNKLTNSMAYLIGPMDEVPDLGADWREMMSKWLWDLDIGVLNPCDKPTNFAKEDMPARDQIEQLKQQQKYDEAHDIVKDIVSVDLHMVDLSSFVIMFIDKDVHMCGSYSEMTYAAFEHKPVIICCKQGKNAVPGWVYGMCDHNLFFECWDDVKSYIRQVALYSKFNDPQWRFSNYNKVFNR